ncbi:MAG: hydrogenase expression/formation protein HypE [Syntrophomonadaceae bacterium]|nr:hydrogenase expression/formation protein HypE [Syntrophomonadaceae bacterium]
MERILLAHGSGGRLSQQLIGQVFRPAWSNAYLDLMLDAAVLELPAGRVAFTTDSFVITPLFFPGGDIGKLAVCGTVNDLVACGARPLFLSAALIIEEGFPLRDLQTIAESMAQAAGEAGVKLVTGDTKVVERGSADGIFINTTGIGVIPAGLDYSPAAMRPGDRVIVTGPVGDHGLAILARREGLSFSTPATSDCAPLHRIGEALAGFGRGVRCLRDPTRGGLATVLNELAEQSGCGISVREQDIPVSPVVRGACDMLGLDPLYLANEGKMVVVAARECAEEVLRRLRQVPEAAQAALIGEVVADPPRMVVIETELGAVRILGTLEGEHVPRIC